MWITISNIADKFRLKNKRIFYAQGPEVWGKVPVSNEFDHQTSFTHFKNAVHQCKFPTWQQLTESTTVSIGQGLKKPENPIYLNVQV